MGQTDRALRYLATHHLRSLLPELLGRSVPHLLGPAGGFELLGIERTELQRATVRRVAPARGPRGP